LPIRPAITADVSSMLAIERASPTAGHFSEAQYRELIEQGLQAETEGQQRLALVIEEDCEVSGFVVGRMLNNEWEIENVVVTAASRKRGLGLALVNELVRIARENGAVKIYLEVRESNVAARRLYGSCKFAEDGRRKNYYRDPVEDAILYTL
jgi:[ribosomal protein S18]-alanine N-acetyltransferase